jgi:hypothetical protein
MNRYSGQFRARSIYSCFDDLAEGKHQNKPQNHNDSPRNQQNLFTFFHTNTPFFSGRILKFFVRVGKRELRTKQKAATGIRRGLSIREKLRRLLS